MASDDDGDISSPDPLTETFDFNPFPSSTQQISRSQSRSRARLSTTAKRAPRTHHRVPVSRTTKSHSSTKYVTSTGSPRKQTFELDVGPAASPQRLFVTVEAEDTEPGSLGSARRRLFTKSPSPSKARARRKNIVRDDSEVTTTIVPLQDIATPRKVSRPRRSATPHATIRSRKPTPRVPTPARYKPRSREVDSRIKENSGESPTLTQPRAAATNTLSAVHSDAGLEQEQDHVLASVEIGMGHEEIETDEPLTLGSVLGSPETLKGLSPAAESPSPNISTAPPESAASEVDLVEYTEGVEFGGDEDYFLYDRPLETDIPNAASDSRHGDSGKPPQVSSHSTPLSDPVTEQVSEDVGDFEDIWMANVSPPKRRARGQETTDASFQSHHLGAASVSDVAVEDSAHHDPAQQTLQPRTELASGTLPQALKHDKDINLFEKTSDTSLEYTKQNSPVHYATYATSTKVKDTVILAEKKPIVSASAAEKSTSPLLVGEHSRDLEHEDRYNEIEKQSDVTGVSEFSGEDEIEPKRVTEPRENDTVAHNEEFTMISLTDVPSFSVSFQGKSSFRANNSVGLVGTEDLDDTSKLIVDKAVRSIFQQADHENHSVGINSPDRPSRSNGENMKAIQNDRNVTHPLELFPVQMATTISLREDDNDLSHSPPQLSSQAEMSELERPAHELRKIKFDEPAARPRPRGENAPFHQSVNNSLQQSVFEEDILDFPSTILGTNTPYPLHTTNQMGRLNLSEAANTSANAENEEVLILSAESINEPNAENTEQSSPQKLITPDETPIHSEGSQPGNTLQEPEPLEGTMNAEPDIRSSPPILANNGRKSPLLTQSLSRPLPQALSVPPSSIVQHSQPKITLSSAVHVKTDLFVFNAPPAPEPVRRPTLSPIVRAGRTLQNILSDPASPQERRNSLGSPFRSSVTRTSHPPEVFPKGPSARPSSLEPGSSLRSATLPVSQGPIHGLSPKSHLGQSAESRTGLQKSLAQWADDIESRNTHKTSKNVNKFSSPSIDQKSISLVSPMGREMSNLPAASSTKSQIRGLDSSEQMTEESRLRALLGLLDHSESRNTTLSSPRVEPVDSKLNTKGRIGQLLVSQPKKMAEKDPSLQQDIGLPSHSTQNRIFKAAVASTLPETAMVTSTAPELNPGVPSLIERSPSVLGTQAGMSDEAPFQPLPRRPRTSSPWMRQSAKRPRRMQPSPLSNGQTEDFSLVVHPSTKEFKGQEKHNASKAPQTAHLSNFFSSPHPVHSQEQIERSLAIDSLSPTLTRPFTKISRLSDTLHKQQKSNPDNLTGQSEADNDASQKIFQQVKIAGLEESSQHQDMFSHMKEPKIPESFFGRFSPTKSPLLSAKVYVDSSQIDFHQDMKEPVPEKFGNRTLMQSSVHQPPKTKKQASGTETRTTLQSLQSEDFSLLSRANPKEELKADSPDRSNVPIANLTDFFSSPHPLPGDQSSYQDSIPRPQNRSPEKLSLKPNEQANMSRNNSSPVTAQIKIPTELNDDKTLRAGFPQESNRTYTDIHDEKKNFELWHVPEVREWEPSVLRKTFYQETTKNDFKETEPKPNISISSAAEIIATKDAIELDQDEAGSAHFEPIPQKQNFTPRPGGAAFSMFHPDASYFSAQPPRELSSSQDESTLTMQRRHEELRPLPARETTPAKSCLRSPSKPRTPGRVVAFTNSAAKPPLLEETKDARSFFREPASSGNGHKNNVQPGSIESDEHTVGIDWEAAAEVNESGLQSTHPQTHSNQWDEEGHIGASKDTSPNENQISDFEPKQEPGSAIRISTIPPAPNVMPQEKFVDDLKGGPISAQYDKARLHINQKEHELTGPFHTVSNTAGKLGSNAKESPGVSRFAKAITFHENHSSDSQITISSSDNSVQYTLNNVPQHQTEQARAQESTYDARSPHFGFSSAHSLSPVPFQMLRDSHKESTKTKNIGNEKLRHFYSQIDPKYGQISRGSKFGQLQFPYPLSHTEWTSAHWARLEQLNEARKAGKLRQLLRTTSDPGLKTRHFVDPVSLERLRGREISAQTKGVCMEIQEWQIDVIKAFIEVVGGWDVKVIAMRLFAIMVGAWAREAQGRRNQKRVRSTMEDERLNINRDCLNSEEDSTMESMLEKILGHEQDHPSKKRRYDAPSNPWGLRHQLSLSPEFDSYKTPDTKTRDTTKSRLGNTKKGTISNTRPSRIGNSRLTSNL